MEGLEFMRVTSPWRDHKSFRRRFQFEPRSYGSQTRGIRVRYLMVLPVLGSVERLHRSSFIQVE